MPLHQPTTRRDPPLVLTHSRRSMLTECPYREFLRYNLGLRPWVAAPPLRFGDLWHRCMAAVYRLHSWWEEHPFGADEPELTAAEAAATVLGEIRHEPEPDYLAELADDQRSLGLRPRLPIIPAGGVVSDWLAEAMATTKPSGDGSVLVYDQQELQEMAALARAMLRGYLERWWAADRQRFEVLAVEHRMRTPIVCPSGHESWKWIYQGDVDAVVRERATGQVYTVEHKTHAGEPEGLFEELRVSPQAEGYSWLWAMEHPDMVPCGVLYRVSRKKAPSVPKRNLCPGTVKEHGVVMVAAADGKREKDHAACTLCHGSGQGPLSTAACDTTAAIYRAALAEAEAAGFPPENKHLDLLSAIESAGPRAWFDQAIKWLRGVGLHGVDPFARFKQETWRLTQAKNRMLAAGERGHWRADSGRVCVGFGRPCSYMSICERNVPDSLELFETDGTLRETFEIQRADK